MILAIASGVVSMWAADDTLQGLKARAAASAGSERAKLFMEVAQREVEVANQRFELGQVELAQKTVAEAVESAQEACTASIESRKRMKKTEIAARLLARRLSAIARTLALDDRPQVESAVERLEEMRRKILNEMFAKKKKKD